MVKARPARPPPMMARLIGLGGSSALEPMLYIRLNSK